jgi:hypothetical protein
VRAQNTKFKGFAQTPKMSNLNQFVPFFRRSNIRPKTAGFLSGKSREVIDCHGTLGGVNFAEIFQ